jgi:UPF0716 protein FxsA
MRIAVIAAVVVFVVLEVAAFALVSQAIGLLAALGLGLASTVAGFLLLRRQGLATMQRIRADAAAGRLPAAALIEAAVIAAAALLMALPGFITDAVGILLFVPALRRLFGRLIKGRLAARMARAERPRRRAGALDRSDYAARPDADSPWRGPAG